MQVHVIMHDLPYLPRYTVTAQQLCINECSSSHECSCDSTKIQILIIKSTNKACETCYYTNPNVKHVKTRLNKN